MAESNGLLDLMKSPAAMGLLAAGFGGLAGANKNTPWNNLGRAGLAGVAGYSAADALQQQQYKIDQEKAIKDAIPNLYKDDGSFDSRGYVALGGSPTDAKAYQDLNSGPQAWKTLEVDDGKGGKQIITLDKNGQPMVGKYSGYVAPVQVNDGQTTRFVQPVAGTTIKQQLSPAEILANQRGQESLNLRRDANSLSRDRLDYDKSGQSGGYSTKPLPIGAVKIQDEALGAIGSAGTIDKILAEKQKLIEDGKLKFGPLSNKANEGLNATGLSTDESRNYASFMSDLERMRNESLRLNMGVQTDKDAERAWNELFQNVNDTDLVKQRLSEIRSINKRGTELQRLRVDGVRSNYNVSPYDFSAYETKVGDDAPSAGGNLTNEQNPPANQQQGGAKFLGFE